MTTLASSAVESRRRPALLPAVGGWRAICQTVSLTRSCGDSSSCSLNSLSSSGTLMPPTSHLQAASTPSGAAPGEKTGPSGWQRWTVPTSRIRDGKQLRRLLMTSKHTEDGVRLTDTQPGTMALA